jgi:two-component system, NtrC family, response regulator AtoC
VQHRILVVDDEKVFLDGAKDELTEKGYLVDTATNAAEVLQKIASDPRGYSLIILDYRLGEDDGAIVARSLHAINPELYIMIYSADPTQDAAIRTWKAGAVEFVKKGQADFLDRVHSWCQKVEHTTLAVSRVSLEGDQSKVISEIGMVGRSPALAKVVADAKKLRAVGSDVLILGESGTGKELIAQALRRGSEMFKSINCASYNSKEPTLMESELFGAEKGAFTGADRTRPGIFEEARGGTVFLDEIHTLSLPAQQKLLRVLQERKVRRVGGTREYPVDFRVIAASKPDLSDRVKNLTFSLDLYYRLKVGLIEVPALYERPEDIEPLVAHFCEKFCKKYKVRKTFMARTVRYMETYSWPGNVRELEHTVEQLVALTDGEKIIPEHLDPVFFTNEPAPRVSSASGLRTRIEQYTRDRVIQALKASKSQREAARRLGIPRSSFHDLLRKLGLSSLKGKANEEAAEA